MMNRKRDYNELTEREAILTLSDKQFDKWADTRWDLIMAYHAKTQTKILPCMKGSHWLHGERYDL